MMLLLTRLRFLHSYFFLDHVNTIFLFLFAVSAFFVVFLGAVLPNFGQIPGFNNDIGLSHIEAFFAFPGIMDSLWLTIYTSVIAFIIAFLGAYFLLRHHIFCEKKEPSLLYSLLIITPHSAIAIGLLFLFFPSGLLIRLLSFFVDDINALQGIWPIPDHFGFVYIGILAFKECAFLYICSLSALTQIPYKQYQTQALTLGYHPKKIFYKVIMPSLLPAMRLPFAIVIFYSFSVVDVSIIAAPNVPPPLQLRLLEFMQHSDLFYRYVASFGAVILWVCMIIAFIVIDRILPAFFSKPITLNLKKNSTVLHSSRYSILSGLYLLITISGAIWLIAWSFYGYNRFPNLIADSFTTKYWSNLIHHFDVSFINSFIVAFCASFFREYHGYDTIISALSQKSFLSFFTIIYPRNDFFARHLFSFTNNIRKFIIIFYYFCTDILYDTL